MVPGALSDMLESARGRMSASPSGVLDMFRWDPGRPYLAASDGDMNCEDEAAPALPGPPLGVVGVYGWNGASYEVAGLDRE
jgi:hypothetical protein